MDPTKKATKTCGLDGIYAGFAKLQSQTKTCLSPGSAKNPHSQRLPSWLKTRQPNL